MPRRFDGPRQLLRAWKRQQDAIDRLSRMIDEAENELEALREDMLDLLMHFPAGLAYDDTVYTSAPGGEIRETPAPAEALDLDGWPGGGGPEARNAYGFPGLAAPDSESA